ncbi:MAG: ligase LigA [Chitinophagaceae bacterium]|nr:ligase LigA [Chitinophagaceae bacterium]
MHTKHHIQELQSQTESLLHKVGKQKTDVADLPQLRQVLRFHEHRYYIMNDPLITDFEYDQLYKSLEKIEADFPKYVTADSPTQRVGKGLTKEFPTVQHLVPMLSLENSYDEDDLVDWDRKAKELTGLTEIEYCIEPKFDGASISLIYEDDFLTRGATRGDGVQGDDITVNIRQIRSIPLSAKFSESGIQQIEIRGEVLINKQTFKKYNEQRLADNLPPLANPRNAASGSLRMVDPKEVAKRGLEAFLYHVSDVTEIPGKKLTKLLDTHSGSLQLLWEAGFRSPVKESMVVKGIQSVIAHCRDYEKMRDELPYEIDGMVIKVNDFELQDKMGMTTHHPRWAIAFKFKARQGTSKLKDVEFQVGRVGSITPVAKIEPVYIGGVTVTSVSLFNEDVIKEKDLMIGDTVLVERAGDVIPYIVRSQAELRTGKEKPIRFPTHCPVCKSELHKPEGESAWRCINPNCEAQVVERLIHFVSKDAMDIRNFGEANIRKFYEMKLLENIPGIYHLDFEKISTLEGFGQKSIDKLKEAVETSKHQTLNRLIYALGIRYVGETTAKTLANSIKNLWDLEKFTVEELMSMEDIGPKVAGSIYEFFQTKEIIDMLKKLEATGVEFSNKKRADNAADTLHGQTFLFTGTLNKLKRSDAEEMVELHGGKLVTGVSSKLNYLVVGEDAGSKLEKAKKINTVRILSEDEFIQMISDKS